MIRTSNPALNSRTFSMPGVYDQSSGVMTVTGTVNKTGILFLLLLISGAFTWRLAVTAGPAAVVPWVFGGMIAGLVTFLVMMFKKTWAPVLAPAYAVFEGLLLGGISAMYGMAYRGIVFQAVGLTLGVMFVMLVAYRTGVVRATEKFKLGVIAATGAVFLIYLVTLVLGLFGVSMPYIHGSGWVGVGFSLVVVVIAALNLVLDFDMIEQGAANGLPKFMEWFAAFGLMVTLIWLYLEILRLLSKLRDR